MFKNMKVASRLALGFGLVSFLLLVVAALGLMRLSALNDSIDVIVKERYAKVVITNMLTVKVNSRSGPTVVGRAAAGAARVHRQRAGPGRFAG